MTKKTRRILPKGQWPMFGGLAGVYEHGAECSCRRCRRLRAQGRPVTPPEWTIPYSVKPSSDGRKR